jgi:hypothetical protein
MNPEHSNRGFQITDEMVRKFLNNFVPLPSYQKVDHWERQWNNFKNTYTSKDNLVTKNNVAGNGKDWEEDKRLFGRFVYADITDIKFGMWLSDNGWVFYDGHDRLINVKGKNIVCPITELFSDYKKANPEP